MSTGLSAPHGWPSPHGSPSQDSPVSAGRRRPSLAPAERVARALEDALSEATGASASGAEPCPEHLAQAMRAAVLSGGGRLRPLLCLAVSASHGEPSPRLADDAAVAVELLHCASLVHDDLPCFDDAELRRGEPTVHRRFGEATAVLVGDALIVHAFDALCRSGSARGPAMVRVLARAAGATGGLVAGQAWESAPSPPARAYRLAKTAGLFAAAGALGALAAGARPEPFQRFGLEIGECYQIADDLFDALAPRDERALGKLAGRDAALGRPNLARDAGPAAARRAIEERLVRARELLPSAPHPAPLAAWLDELRERLDAFLSATR